jgi:hypothetical protein
MSFLIGLAPHRGAMATAIWASGFFLMLFLHELAHTLAGLPFGAPAEVHLTTFRDRLGPRIASLSPVPRILVSLAGPAANLAIGAATLAFVRWHPAANDWGAGGLRYFGWTNIGWGLVNLLPIWPLDAAHVLATGFDWLGGARGAGQGEALVRRMSVAAAVVFGLAAVAMRLPWAAALCALVAIQNSLALQGARARADREAILRVRSAAAFEAMERGDATVAIGHCMAVLEGSSDAVLRRDAVRLLAYAYATGDEWRKLLDLLESGGALALDPCDLQKYQRAAQELGRAEDAQRLAFLASRLA